MAYTTIDDPSAHFQIDLYTGDGQGSGNNVITNDGNSDLQPDWIWTKERTNTSGNQNHTFIDTSRGINKQMFGNLTSNDATSSNFITQIDTDGFRLGDNANINNNGSSYVAWQWKANGGTTSSNSDGSITSTVQANTTAGFSIVTYTGNSTAGATVGHGLGVVPNWIIVKDRDADKNWVNYHKSIGNDRSITLNTSDAQSASTDHWNNNTPTSSVFYLGDYSHVNTTDDYVAYCFAEKQGYSKFGSYTGNGNADGPFVYTGFKPAWVMIKRTSDTNNWHINDNKRDTFNVVDAVLYANTSDAEATDTTSDFLSNGFKLRTTVNFANGSGDTYIYMAFAEHPFVSSKGVPVTAR